MLDNRAVRTIYHLFKDPWTCSVDVDPEKMRQSIRDILNNLMDDDSNIFLDVDSSIIVQADRSYEGKRPKYNIFHQARFVFRDRITEKTIVDVVDIAVKDDIVMFKVKGSEPKWICYQCTGEVVIPVEREEVEKEESGIYEIR